MASATTITFRRERPTAGGFAVPEGSDIPVMPGRKNARLSDLVALLDEVLATLAATPCSFWACRGPRRPRHMVTCGKCWSMRSIATVRATLVRAVTPGAPDRSQP